MHAEVGAVMIGLSRLGFKTLIVACAIASVAFPQAGFAQQPATPPVTKTTVTAAPVVFAAASMETALDAIAGSWAAQSGRSPSIVYASSAALAKQIEQGAPADIFISADTNWMDYLDNKKLISARDSPRSPRQYAGPHRARQLPRHPQDRARLRPHRRDGR